VLTAKHATAFCYGSKVDGYNISAPFHRDVCAEPSGDGAQTKRENRLVFFRNDWRDPDCRSENMIVLLKIQAELRELLSNYGKFPCFV